MSMKNYKDNIGNRTRDLPACSAVPQPNAPPRTVSYVIYIYPQILRNMMDVKREIQDCIRGRTSKISYSNLAKNIISVC